MAEMVITSSDNQRCITLAFALLQWDAREGGWQTVGIAPHFIAAHRYLYADYGIFDDGTALKVLGLTHSGETANKNAKDKNLKT